MDATDVNWEPILEMLPTQEMNDYDERMKYERLEFPFNLNSIAFMTRTEIQACQIYLYILNLEFNSLFKMNKVSKYLKYSCSGRCLTCLMSMTRKD